MNAPIAGERGPSMDEQLQQLVVSISTLIRKVSEGAISPEDARDEYRSLRVRHDDLRDRAVDAQGGVIKNLCARHNGENFSLFSGLFRLTPEHCEPIDAVGDDRLLGKVIQASAEIRASIRGGSPARIEAGRLPFLAHHLHVARVHSGAGEEILFAAVSSSEFFSRDRFVHAAGFFSDLLAPFLRASRPLMLVQFERSLEAIRDHLDATVNAATSARISLFFLKSVDTIFSHMGMAALVEIPKTIHGILSEVAPEDAAVFSLSMNEYLVISPIRRSDESIPKMRPVELKFRGTIIPHHSIQLRFDDGDSVYKLLDDIYNFEDYMLTGDITR